jgi:hypothetical protein
MRTYLTAVCSVVVLGTTVLSQRPGHVPFTIVGRDVKSQAFTLLVAAGTTDEQLTELVDAFRVARISKTLNTLIPPTTPGAQIGGPYNVVVVFVISDPAARGDAMLHMFISETSTLDNQKEWGKRILAYYWYSSLAPKGHQEEGTLGYQYDRVIYTSRFKRLFQD